MYLSDQMEVDVLGGSLMVARSGTGPVVLALHTTTGSHLSWDLLARQTEHIRLVAPDLRGRGQSAGLPRPYGIGQHLADLGAVLNTVVHQDGGVTVLGHGSGGALGVLLAATYPDLVDKLVLVDARLPSPTDVSAGSLTVELPSVRDRLAATFDNRAEYHALARRQPAFAAWTAHIREYVDYELVEDSEKVRCRTSYEALEADALDWMERGPQVADALRSVEVPVVCLRAGQGMHGEPPPLVDDDAVRWLTGLVPSVRWITEPAANHYTIVNSPPHVRRLSSELLGEARHHT